MVGWVGPVGIDFYKKREMKNMKKEIILIVIESEYIDNNGKPWDSYFKLVYNNEDVEAEKERFEDKKKKLIEKYTKEENEITSKEANLDDVIDVYTKLIQIENSMLKIKKYSEEDVAFILKMDSEKDDEY